MVLETTTYYFTLQFCILVSSDTTVKILMKYVYLITM